ncbi:MAG: UxaA family hydrolase [Anaerolineae bacterium]|nr:UxaA family hydrolase [Anaerolineae bacterium]
MSEWLGYVRPDGTVGARNLVLILSGTLYANNLCRHVSNMIYGSVSIEHPLGRTQVAPDLRLTRKFLSGTGANPNVGAVVIIDHFREENCTAEDIAHDISPTGKLIATVNIRYDGGYIKALDKALHYAADFTRQLSNQRREPVPVSKMLFGVNCGTSDTTSGLSSNVATGMTSDRIIEQGGRTILAETTEWMGAEPWFMARAENDEIRKQITDAIAHMEARALASGEDIRGSQPTGDNILGGLSSIEEKSMGATKKAGTKSKIVGYLDIADRPGEKSGLYVMYGPGHGGESISSIAAAGAQVLVFSTGGGHTISHPIMPTIKVTGNRNSYEAMQDTVDLDVSGILHDEITMEQGGEMVYDEVMATASGRLTKSEVFMDHNGFAIHRIGVSI